MTDVSALERSLHDLSLKNTQQDDERFWSQVVSTSQALANALRFKEAAGSRTFLGQTSLPQSLKLLLTAALKDAPIPTGKKAKATLELIRVFANFCIDDTENSSHLLEASVIQIVLSLLEAYSEKLLATVSQTQLSLDELKLLRTALGALLNACLTYEEVKNRLNSLEAGQTTLRLMASIYSPGSWVHVPKDSLHVVEEEWDLRSTISTWGLRLVAELRNVKDEVQIFSVDILPLLTPPLSAFIPPLASADTSFFNNSSILSALVERDFDALEDACTLIESLALDVEDIRLALARGFFSPAEHLGVPCLSTVLDFVELGDYPLTWGSSKVFDDTERARKQKDFGMCKSALVKAIVEVAGEEKNAEILWDGSDASKPGGPFVYRMVNWIKSYVAQASDADDESVHGLRDDLVIAASLSLGNLSRRESRAAVLVSSPYSLAPILASHLFLSPRTDLKLKHAVLALLKNLAQSTSLSPITSKALADSNVLQRLADSGVWDERSDIMADVVQLNAIGVAKHLCNADVEHTFALTTLPPSSSTPSGLAQIIALVKRTDSVYVKSEGTRVLVNAIRSLWAPESSNQSPSPERQRNRESSTRAVLTQESADALTVLLARSGRHPVLINESVLALTLLSMHYDGAQLVLAALNKPTHIAPPTEPIAASPMSDVSSPVATSPLSARPMLPVPRHALDMLVFVLRNVDNPANYPQEVRMNVCSLLLQLTRHSSEDDLAKIKEATRSTLEKLTNRLQSATGKDEVLRNSIQKVLSAWA
ncbi:hypothetical protein AN958_03232 [Leucoagaricus sp. SymC.cos]|nr:hypothetical protein AN958_03232 [Leucoagaricus sp. SymC.cos]